MKNIGIMLWALVGPAAKCGAVIFEDCGEWVKHTPPPITTTLQITHYTLYSGVLSWLSRFAKMVSNGVFLCSLAERRVSAGLSLQPAFSWIISLLCFWCTLLQQNVFNFMFSFTELPGDLKSVISLSISKTYSKLSIIFSGFSDSHLYVCVCGLCLWCGCQCVGVCLHLKIALCSLTTPSTKQPCFHQRLSCCLYLMNADEDTDVIDVTHSCQFWHALALTGSCWQ